MTDFTTIGIRVDGDANIGMGHVMRCISLAEALQCNGFKALFICATPDPVSTIRSKGFDVIVLQTAICASDYGAAFDDTAIDLFNSELPEIIALIKTHRLAYMVLDSYAIRDDYASCVNSTCKTFAFCGHRLLHRGLTIACDYNLSASAQWLNDTFARQGTQVLCGPRYAPLRSAYWTPFTAESKRSRRSILLTTGSTDKFGVTEKILSEFCHHKSFKNVDKHVAIGSFFPHKERLYAMSADDPTIIPHDNPALFDLFSKVDVAVSAAGTTVYELMAVGIPACFFALVDNQLLVEGSLKDLGYCGDIRKHEGKECLKHIIDRAEELLSSKEKRTRVSRQYKTLTDGKGALRIARAIAESIHN